MGEFHCYTGSTRLQVTTFCQLSPIPFTKATSLNRRMLSFLSIRPMSLRRRMLSFRLGLPWYSLSFAELPSSYTCHQSPLPHQDPKSDEHMAGRWAGHFLKDPQNFPRQVLQSNMLDHKKILEQDGPKDKLTMAKWRLHRTLIPLRRQQKSTIMPKHLWQRFQVSEPVLKLSSGCKRTSVQVSRFASSPKDSAKQVWLHHRWTNTLAFRSENAIRSLATCALYPHTAE